MNSECVIDESGIASDAGYFPTLQPVRRLNVQDFLIENRENIMEMVRRDGAVLMRRFKLNNMQHFRQAVSTLSKGEILDYENRSTPRTELGDKVFTSTEYPADSHIPLHNENSYTHSYPRYLYFFCLQSSRTGGQTPVADSARIYDALNRDVVEQFESSGISYVRNYGDVDLPWQEVFGTDCKETVEDVCTRNGIRFSWNDGRLTTTETRPASVTNPVTGRRVWFNQAHLFHYSNLGDAAGSMLDLYGIDRLPRNATLGNGEPIPSSSLDHIREVMSRNEILFDWQPSDLLIVDNLRMAHGRKPFSGDRKILVMMSHGLRS